MTNLLELFKLANDLSLSFSHLEKLGLIKKQEGKTNFNVVRKGFNLIVDNVNEGEPNDIAYVYSGYCSALSNQTDEPS